MSNKLLISFIFLIVFHLIGSIGLMGDQPGFFVRNTPLNLLLSVFFLLINHGKWSTGQVLGLTAIFIAGFTAEVIGTNTGYLFGNYWYGKTLGFKLFNVPLIIGLNWLMMIYVVGNIIQLLQLNDWLKASLGAFMLLILDYFMEPVAIYLDFWQWEDGRVPFTNYLCWFIISFLFLSLFFKIGFRKYNPVAAVLFLLQLMMFVVLYFRIR